MKILIVDDEKELREILSDLFQMYGGFSVSSASDGVEALNLIKQEEFDCLLTDINMPKGLDGISLVKRIKEEYPKNIKDIYIMSGYADNEELITELEIKGFFPKPLPKIKDVILQIKKDLV